MARTIVAKLKVLGLEVFNRKGSAYAQLEGPLTWLAARHWLPMTAACGSA
jgi:hypothetical protein